MESSKRSRKVAYFFISLRRKISDFIYLFCRAITSNTVTGPEEQFAYLTKAIGVVSGQQSQSQFRLSLLENANKVKVCRDHEETEGRINTDLLNRVIIVGGPLVPPSDDLQDLLIRQVSICKNVLKYFRCLFTRNF
jgi:hypothetical protein